MENASHRNIDGVWRKLHNELSATREKHSRNRVKDQTNRRHHIALLECTRQAQFHQRTKADDKKCLSEHNQCWKTTPLCSLFLRNCNMASRTTSNPKLHRTAHTQIKHTSWRNVDALGSVDNVQTPGKNRQRGSTGRGKRLKRLKTTMQQKGNMEKRKTRVTHTNQAIGKRPEKKKTRMQRTRHRKSQHNFTEKPTVMERIKKAVTELGPLLCKSCTTTLHPHGLLESPVFFCLCA